MAMEGVSGVMEADEPGKAIPQADEFDKAALQADEAGGAAPPETSASKGWPIGLDAVRLSALAFLCFWHLGIQLYFMQSVWWHFLDPANLAIDLGAVSCLFGVCVMAPLLMEIPQVFLFLTKYWWVFIGVVPAVLLPFTSVPDQPKLRTFLLGACSIGGYIGNAVALSLPAGVPLSRYWPWALSLGVLVMQVVQLGWSSVNPTMSKHYNDPEHAYLGFKLAACLVAVIASAFLRKGCTDVSDSSPSYAIGEPQAEGCCQDRRAWSWLAVGPLLACALTLNVAFMSNPGAMAKHAGLDPFPAGIAVLVCFALGAPCAYGLAKFGAALPIYAAVALLGGATLLGGDAQCRGGSCSGFNSFAGAIFLSLAQPALFMVISIQASRIARSPNQRRCCASMGAIGRLFAFSGFLIFLHVFLYIAAITHSSVPSIGGRLNVWLYLVICPAIVGLMVVVALHFKDRGLAKAFTPTAEAQALDAPVKRLGPTPKAACMVLGAILFILSLPAIGIRSSQSVTSRPSNATAFTVMAFNNMQGYDTAGSWNGECFVDLVRSHAPDHVAIPEGDSMRAFTGNRDAVEYASTSLRMYTDFGPPGWVGGVGVGVLSTLDFRSSSWQPMPKEAGLLNRFLVKNVYSFNGVALTVLSIHAEWFGNPSTQVAFIAATAAAVNGPVIVAGDFNLEPNGASNNAPNATGFKSMLDAGLQSVTPLVCKGSKPAHHRCRSSHPNVVVGKGCVGLDSCDGYQLDYIFYSPKWLRVVPSSVRVIEGKVGDSTWCSDHQPLLATFELAQ